MRRDRSRICDRLRLRRDNKKKRPKGGQANPENQKRGRQSIAAALRPFAKQHRAGQKRGIRDRDADPSTDETRVQGSSPRAGETRFQSCGQPTRTPPPACFMTRQNHRWKCLARSNVPHATGRPSKDFPAARPFVVCVRSEPTSEEMSLFVQLPLREPHISDDNGPEAQGRLRSARFWIRNEAILNFIAPDQGTDSEF